MNDILINSVFYNLIQAVSTDSDTGPLVELIDDHPLGEDYIIVWSHALITSSWLLAI